MRVWSSLMAGTLCIALAMPAPAQVSPTPSPGPGQARPEAGTKTFSQAELDQLLAPIALYPDSLLSQILMASRMHCSNSLGTQASNRSRYFRRCSR